MKCRNCKNKLDTRILNLGSQPISSVFYSKKKLNLKKYSLDLYQCQKCELIQFKKLAPLDDMYGTTYGYRTSLSNLMIGHIKEKYKKIIKKKIIKKNDIIIDIGSNDATFLNFFAKEKINNISLFGVDPSADKFKKYYNKKINLITDFFNQNIANKLIKNFNIKNRVKLITSFAMFYDIEDPNSFCNSINSLLSENGKWILELSYFPLLLKNLTYDQICHEHVTYYTLSTFKKIIEKNNLKIQDIDFNEINGGSVEITCIKKGSKLRINKKKINYYLNEERNIDKNSYINLQKRIDNTKNILNILLNNINKNEIIGYGASTKGNIVLNHCGINSNQIKYICDANSEKHGKFTPGSNIKIISKEKMRKLNPKYLLVFIWSFRKEVIIQEEDYLKKGGTLIFHLPSLHVINKFNYKNYIDDNFETFSFNF